jgi:hypothetical protein
MNPSPCYAACRFTQATITKPCVPQTRLEGSAHINRREAMTTDRQMEMMYSDQEQVIVALRSIGEPDLARLDRCTTARREQRTCGATMPAARIFS